MHILPGKHIFWFSKAHEWITFVFYKCFLFALQLRSVTKQVGPWMNHIYFLQCLLFALQLLSVTKHYGNRLNRALFGCCFRDGLESRGSIGAAKFWVTRHLTIGLINYRSSAPVTVFKEKTLPSSPHPLPEIWIHWTYSANAVHPCLSKIMTTCGTKVLRLRRARWGHNLLDQVDRLWWVQISSSSSFVSSGSVLLGKLSSRQSSQSSSDAQESTVDTSPQKWAD